MPNSFPASTADGAMQSDPLLSVSALNRLARTYLERGFPLLRVTGEISNLTRAPSGHVYFTLKDEQAQVRCTMWRNRAQLVAFRPANGMQVEARATVTLYEQRGDFQLSIETLRQAGTGSLFEAFVRLKERLAAQGLFDPARKRSVPCFPRRVGVVTSPAAAALQDVLAAFRRRAPHLELVLYPAPVQGEGAASELAETLRTASTRATLDGVDLLLLVRGGGSLEDLWAFNDEGLAHAIRASAVPVICGVGHETDFTIADFAADLRAATPTGAAELATAGFHEAANRLSGLAQSMSAGLRSHLATLAQRLDRASLRLVHPGERLRQSGVATARARERLQDAMTRRLERSRAGTDLLGMRLLAQRPDLRREFERCARLAEHLRKIGVRSIEARSRRLDALAAHFAHLDPHAVLARGYSITRDSNDRILRCAAEIQPGGTVTVQLAVGRLDATVTSTEP